MVVVGVNRYQDEGRVEPELHRLDPAAEARQAERTRAFRAGRNATRRPRAPGRRRAPRRASDVNLLEPMRAALAERCTIGEICDVLRDEWGTYDALIAGGR